eukprot:CAMPEP_0115883546 /NCGR_PEP_ID=MMETSP0287-20121206/29622_1 /TAXON_ID=412157 /ORGANISM="Chrysochromulina rotalis, Strain UIO044" /LENGTH=92 /DNA_ID=CAMNT_0003339751 /DNA_START=292 /DNA_END=570 /DNA_ORIENTATION=+
MMMVRFHARRHARQFSASATPSSPTPPLLPQEALQCQTRAAPALRSPRVSRVGVSKRCAGSAHAARHRLDGPVLPALMGLRVVAAQQQVCQS